MKKYYRPAESLDNLTAGTVEEYEGYYPGNLQVEVTLDLVRYRTGDQSQVNLVLTQTQAHELAEAIHEAARQARVGNQRRKIGAE